MLSLNEEEIYICRNFINKPITIEDVEKLKQSLKGYIDIELHEDEKGESEGLIKDVISTLLAKLEGNTVVEELNRINFNRSTVFDK